MLLVLCPDKFVDRLCKKSPSSIDELCKRAKDHIQREEMSKFWNEVGQKRDKCEAHTKPNLHKLDKRHKPNKREPFPKGLRYEHYAPLTTNHTMILEEAFNLEVPIRLP